MTTPIPRPVLIFLAVCITMMLALLALRALEIQLPMLALWVFVLLSLTLGFGHGALDAVLLLGQFEPLSKAFGVSLVYFLCVLLAGWVLSWSVPWALLLLVLLSVWHFGEMYSYSLWARLCVGGASVMWPILVAQHAMAELVRGTLGSGFNAVWSAWYVLANCWLILVFICAIVLAVRWVFSRKKRNESGSGDALVVGNQHLLWSAAEILSLLYAYLMLSPLLAFALYFGVYHCVTHMARVRRAVLTHSAIVLARYATALMVSVLATLILLGLLWWYLHSAQWLGIDYAIANPSQLLQWLVVSLAAVTLPHLVLVSYSAHWLGR